MKRVLATIGFSVIALLSAMNVNLLWDESVIGELISMLYAAVGSVLALGLIFVPMENKWLIISKSLALITMLLTAMVPIYEFEILHPLEFLIIPANVVLAFVCIVSLFAIHRRPNHSLVVK